MTQHVTTANKLSPGSLLLYQIFFVVLWGSGAIVVTLGLKYTDPLTFLFFRIVLAALVMLIIAIATKAPWPKDKSTLIKTIITGLLIQFAYITSFFYALHFGVTPTVITIILALQPLLTALITRQASNLPQYIGIILGLFGVVLTVAHDLSDHAMTFLGFVFAIISVSCITLGSLVQKHNTHMDLRTGSVIQFAASIIPIGLLNYFFGSFKLPMEPVFLFSLSWMVFVVSIAAICLYYKLLKEGSAVAVNSLFYLVPAITAVLSYFIFGTRFDVYLSLGIVLIVLGVYITQKSSGKA